MGQQRLKVLVADSNSAAAGTVAEQLRARGIDVILAGDAVRALTMARDLRPDAIVMSAGLAGGAAGAIKRIRSNVYTTDIPVVAIAGSRAQAAELEQAGAHASVHAPAGGDKLEEALRRHQLQDLDFTQAPPDALQAPERMADLSETQLLDTPPEECFDRVTRLAAHLLAAPVAIVSLVDRDRQFLKSQTGLAEPLASERQIGLSHSFCQWVVSGNEPLVVADAKDHPVLCRSPAVRDLGVTAYAGVPLLGRTGQPIGSFCAIDSKPREWNDEDLDTLEDLARITRAYVVLHHARKEDGKNDDGRAVDSARNLEISATVAGHAIVGAENILRRRADGLDAEARADLHSIIAEQAGHLTRAV